MATHPQEIKCTMMAMETLTDMVVGAIAAAHLYGDVALINKARRVVTETRDEASDSSVMFGFCTMLRLMLNDWTSYPETVAMVGGDA